MPSKCILAALRRRACAVGVERGRAGSDQNPFHLGLEATRASTPSTSGRRRKAISTPRSLDVTIDQGEGSAATVTRVMSGTYDAGFGDVNAIIQPPRTKPGEAPVMVYMIYNKPPFALLTKTDSPIKSLKDMAGYTTGLASRRDRLRLFSLLAKKNGLDPAKVEILNMAPNLQEQMLLQGQVDISAVFTVDQLHEPDRR